MRLLGNARVLGSWLPFLVWSSLVVAIIVCADTGKIREVFSFMGRLPGADKLAHAVLIGTLAFLLDRALQQRKFSVGRWRLLAGSLIVAVLITAEELSQIWLPNRTFDLGDLAANYLGIGCVVILAKTR